MDKKSLIILVVVFVIVVAIVVLGVLFGGQSGLLGGGREGDVEAPADTCRPDEPDALPTVEGGTRKILSREIAAPQAGATSTPEDVAIPIDVTSVGKIDLYTFEIKGEGGKFIPSTLVVNELDLLIIRLTAVDADYNLSFPDFGVNKNVSQGETVKFQIQAGRFGEYQFFCTVCVPEVVGTLIVNEK